jgi:hypothetical protein
MFAYNYELPTHAQMMHTRFNKMGTIVGFTAHLWFKDGRTAYLEAGADLPHRSFFEIVGADGVIRVED